MMTPRKPEPQPISDEEISGWFAGRLPDDWFTGPPEIETDRDEALLIGTIPRPEADPEAQDQATWSAAADSARIDRFREETRAKRMAIADEAESRFGRTVSWGARCGDEETVFTHLSIPMMTRLRLDERKVLDTLVDASVARSRSEALAWCVKLVAEHESEWIGELRDALQHVEKVRSERG